MRAGAGSETVWLGLGIVLAAAYALPCLAPPVPAALGVAAPADAWLLTRIFPGVPALFVGLRLAALAGAAVLLAARPFDAERAPSVSPVATGALPWRIAALASAALHVAVVPAAGGFGPGGQVAYLTALALPAALLWLGERAAGGGSGAGAPAAHGAAAATADDPPAAIARGSMATAATVAVVATWIALRCITDLGSPRTADVIDGWRGFLDVFRLASERQNLLTELFDPNLPGVSAVVAVFQGVPAFQAGLVPFGMRAAQGFQIAAVALTALALARLAAVLVAPGTAALAAAVFLFAPYTRFMTLFPGPFLAAPLYAVALALAAEAAVRRRSEAALALLGALAGVAAGYPSVVPLLGFVGAWTLWRLRGDLGRLAVGVVAGLGSLVAAIAPAAVHVFVPGRFGTHFRWDGLITIIDAGLLGQLPLASTPPAFDGVAQRPLDVIVSALLAPFANPRIALRLWGDVLFDPVGEVCLAVGLVACVAACRRSWSARALVVAYAVALAPAFVSPVDVANVSYAAVLPAVAALIAAVGVVALPVAARARRVVIAATTVAVVVGGTLVFDVVNPRTLPASSFGIMFEVTPPPALRRVVVLGYGPDFVRPTKTLYTGPITAFTASEPVGFLPWNGGPLPVAELAAEGKDVLFWSHGYDRDLPVAAAICATWPDATLYEIVDRAGLGRVHAARLGAEPWEPAASSGRWTARRCGG